MPSSGARIQKKRDKNRLHNHAEAENIPFPIAVVFMCSHERCSIQRKDCEDRVACYARMIRGQTNGKGVTCRQQKKRLCSMEYAEGNVPWLGMYSTSTTDADRFYNLNRV